MGVFQFSIQSNKKYMNKINVQREGYTGIPRTKPHMRFFGINKSLNSINSFFLIVLALEITIRTWKRNKY